MAQQQADLECITKVLLESEAYPAGARQMLLEGLQHAVVPVGARHEFQADFARLAQEALLATQRWAQENKATWTEGVQTTESQLNEKKAALAEAAAREEAARVEFEAKVALHAQIEQDVAQADSEHKEVEMQNADMVAEREKLREEIAAAAAVFDGSFRMLVDGGWADDEMKMDALAGVQEHLKSIEAEKVLQGAAPAALSLRPEARRDFDKLTAEMLVQTLHGHAASLDGKLAEGAPMEKEAWAEGLGLWALLDVSRDKEVAARKEKLEAQVALAEATKEHKAATKEVAEQDKALSNFLAKQTAWDAKASEIADAQAAMERLIAYDGEADVEMAEAPATSVLKPITSADKAEDLVVAEQMSSRMPTPTGNPFGVATPMAM